MSEGKAGRPSDQAFQARVQALNAAQWLARFTNSFAAHASDELELRWDHGSGRIVTPEVESGLALGLSLPTLVLQFAEGGEPSPHPIDIDGRSSAEVEAWILVELLHRGVDRDGFSKKLPYQPADLMSGDEPKYSPQELAEELKRIDAELGDAATTLIEARRRFDRGAGSTNGAKAPRDDGRADLVCWPENMEIGFVVPGGEGHTPDLRIKVGFGGAESQDAQPRYFVALGSERSSELALSQIETDRMSRADVVDRLVRAAADLGADLGAATSSARA